MSFSYKVPHRDVVDLKYRGCRTLKRGNTNHRRSSCVYEPMRGSLLLYRCCCYCCTAAVGPCSGRMLLKIKGKCSGQRRSCRSTRSCSRCFCHSLPVLPRLLVRCTPDHGKTTLVDAMLQQSSVFRDNEQVRPQDCCYCCPRHAFCYSQTLHTSDR